MYNTNILSLPNCILILSFIFFAISFRVKTDTGMVSGGLNITNGKRVKYYYFAGIPYAEPPIGNLRFKPPQNQSNIRDMWIAMKEKNNCFSINFDIKSPITGSEDCLYLNVYTQSPKTRGHGYRDHYAMDYFIEENLVVVSINYRLGLLGFYHNEKRGISGNMGLKDQVMALEWVRRNIERFGGDPHKVTIMGESAGAACVSYLVQSPRVQGLFQRAIMQSGNSLATWSVGKPSTDPNILESFIRFLGSNNKMLAVIRNLNMLYKVASDPLKGLQYAPVIERPNPRAIVTEKSVDVLKKCRTNQNHSFVPILIGHNSHEGRIFTISSSVTKFLSTLYSGMYSRKVNALLPLDVNKTECGDAGNEIKRYYRLKTPEELGKFIGDLFFVLPTLHYVNMYSKCNDVYFYKLSYKDAVHSEDLNYLFSNTELHTKTDKEVSKKMVKLWSNFVRYGNPTPTPEEFEFTWPTSNSFNDYAFLNIDKRFEILPSINGPNFEDYTFWKNIYTACNAGDLYY